MSKKVIVTGGAGFIGSHTVVELVNSGFEPVIIDSFVNSDLSVPTRIEQITGKKISLHQVDCRDEKAMQAVFQEEGEVFGVIHFAALKSVSESISKALEYYDNNLGSLTTLLKVMRIAGIRQLVFSSSCTVYGQPDQLPVTEESPLKTPESPYGTTKQMCERILTDAAATQNGLKAISLRYFNPVGAHPSGLIGELPSGKPENLVPYITQTGAGIREKLTVFGDDYNTPDGTCIRDFIHVVDLSQAHIRALEWLNEQSHENFNEFLNLGTGQGASVLELIHAFEKENGIKLNFEIGPRRSGDIEKIWADTQKAKNYLNWEPSLGIEDAMRDAWNWQKALGKS